MFKEQKQISTHICVFKYFKQTLCTQKFLDTVLKTYQLAVSKLKCKTMCNGRPATFHLAEGKCNSQEPFILDKSFLDEETSLLPPENGGVNTHTQICKMNYNI